MLKLDTVDSTNNYAMQLIEADTAAHGMAILANKQTAGKGQRGKSWSDVPGASLLMSIIIAPDYSLEEQPPFLALIATAVAEIVQELVPHEEVTIKWPNDILIGDKKAAGILIENIVRGTGWQWAVTGIGLNVNQDHFPEALPYATSLRIMAGTTFSIEKVAMQIQGHILSRLQERGGDIMAVYNKLLYRCGMTQLFKDGDTAWQAIIVDVNKQGRLLVKLADGTMQQYTHGTVEWVWE